MIHYNSLLKMISLLSVFAAQTVLATAQMDRPLIITTIKPLAIIAQSAVGDQARVEYLQSAVQSAHALSLPISALKKIDQADLIIWIGEIFESRVAKPMASVPGDKLITALELPMTASSDVGNPQVAADSGDHSHSSHDHLKEDPHVWLNPQNANLIAAEIQRRLNLPLKEIISAEQIASLTAELAPLSDKQFLVHHDALGHFTSTFKLQPGLSIRDASGASQGVRSQYRLRQEAKASAASCVFVEPQYADRDAKIIADELSLPVALIDIQGLDQALDDNAYASFMQTLASQVKSCFDR
jgi:zinc transport system substrate-binding protein